jgi:hypothetical protein
MKVINKTEWQTRHLKTFVSRVCDQELVDPQYRKRLKVTFDTRRRKHNTIYDAYASGWAWYHSAQVVVHLVRGVPPNKASLAMVLAHEIAHNHNVRHRALNGTSRYDFHGDWEKVWGWANELPLELKPVGVKTEPTIQDRDILEYERSIEMARKWATKLKLANGKRQKWLKRAGYFEAKLKKAALTPKAGNETGS